MDKYEYKVCADEIVKLIGEERYIEAAEIADTIDWRKVRSVSMLLRVAALYRVNRRNEDGRDILILAYERYPSNRSVLYSLCEVSIELDDIVAAIEYCKEFAKYAQGDNSLFILRYKILEAQEASLEERIHVLEEYKKRDYQEEWAYELAYLYHRVGLGTKCVEECDDLILWFGDGPYVRKAMELKMLHAPLTSVQQIKYDCGLNGEVYSSDEQKFVQSEETVEQQTDSIDMSQYNTINLQKVVAESMRELFPEDEDIYQAQQTELVENEAVSESFETPFFEEEAVAMQEEIASLTQEQEPVEEVAELLPEQDAEDYVEPVPRHDISEMVEGVTEQMPDVSVGAVKKVFVPDNSTVFMQDTAIEDVREISEEAVIEEQAHYEESGESVYAEAPKVEFRSSMAYAHTGNTTQITLEGCEDAAVQYIQNEEAVPEVHNYVRPLTGQMDIEAVISEWERLKRESAERYENETRQRVLQQTGSIFIDFDQSIKSGPWANMTEDLGEVEELEEIADFTEEIEQEEIVESAEESEFEEIAELVEEEAVIEETASEETVEEEVSVEETLVKETQEEEVVEYIHEAEEEIDDIEASEMEEAVAVMADVSEDTAITDEGAEIVQRVSDDWNMSDSVDEMEEITENVVEEILEQEEAQEEVLEQEELVTEEDILKTQDIMLNTAEISSLPDKIIEATEKETTGVERQELRDFTSEEQELFENFAVTKKIKKQILFALDKMSLAAYTGNVLITGEPGLGTVRLAKNLIREFQAMDGNFSGKVAKISGDKLNEKDLKEVFDKLNNGALIIEQANGLTEDTLYEMTSLLNQDNLGVLILMEDTRKEITKLLEKQAMVADYFNIRIDLAEMDNNALVAYAKKYALALEYSIDELATLALYTRISNIQTGNHIVTKDEVRDIVDEAIWKSKKFRLKNFVDILLSKRYDEEDMIVLKERDFM
ncbi:MAG: hypothetical protein IJ326_01305 [Lachnospiraceae bacterium]|nr:hypothetical protein [Lachnospiraceae bacterium]